LTFTYRGASRPALQNVSYRHHPGEFIAIMGPTGAGKSTFCRCLNGLIPAFTKGTLIGEMTVMGEPVDPRSVYRTAQRIGLVFQDFEAQLFSTNVELEVAFTLENFAVSPTEMRPRVDQALKRVGLTGFGARDPSTLSGGEKQRLAIASVLAGGPSVLVMDEPTTDLDPIGKRDIFALCAALRNEIKGIVLVEHETEHVILADRLVIVSDGRIVRSGPPSDTLVDPEFLEGLGVRPLQTTVLLRKLGLPSESLGVEDTAEAVRRAGWRAAPPPAPQATPVSTFEPIIEINGLTHRYAGGGTAVSDVSLTLHRGEFVAVVGQNGCGKTTLVKHFNALHLPSKGSVKVLGKDTRDWALPELGRHVGYVFQNPDHQIFADTVGEEVAFSPKNYGFSTDEIDGRVRHALEIVGLAGRENDDPFALTKGERQQLALASVLATTPVILVLDEPTTGLDYHGQTAILNLVRKLNRTGVTVIMVTHTMWVVAEYAERCIVMQGGHVVLDGDVYACFRDPGLLASLALQAPEVVRIGRLLGVEARSVEELVSRLEK